MGDGWVPGVAVRVRGGAQGGHRVLGSSFFGLWLSWGQVREGAGVLRWELASTPRGPLFRLGLVLLFPPLSSRLLTFPVGLSGSWELPYQWEDRLAAQRRGELGPKVTLRGVLELEPSLTGGGQHLLAHAGLPLPFPGLDLLQEQLSSDRVLILRATVTL